MSESLHERYTKFHDQIKRLKDTFGQTHYPKERTDILFEAVGSRTSPEQFKTLVDKCISEFSKAPTPNEIKLLAYNSNTQISKGPEQFSVSPCSKCNNHGYLTSEDSKGYSWMVLCICKNAERVQNNFSTAGENFQEWQKKYPTATFKAPKGVRPATLQQNSVTNV